MLLLEALSHKSPMPATIIKPSYWAGRQYRWCNGHIQTRTVTGKWHRTINIPTSFLESCEVDDNEIL